MATSNINLLIVSLPHSDHQCSSSSSQTPDATSYNNIQEDQNVNLVSGGLKIQVPSSAGADDPMTPRSIDHRIPVTAACPPAPRKARRVPVTGKRKAPILFPVVRVPADFIVYVDAILALNETVYVPDIVVGDLGKGDHAKKIKLLRAPAHDL